jgi:hypothetical protein
VSASDDADEAVNGAVQAVNEYETGLQPGAERLAVAAVQALTAIAKAVDRLAAAVEFRA